MTTTVNPNDELLLAFIDESLHSIHGLAEQITAYLHNPANSDSINGVFRTVHSIKGNAGFFGLSVIKKFAHAVENTLDDIRNQKLALTEELNRALIDSFDRINGLLQQVEQNDIPDELSSEEVSLLERITDLSLASGGGCSSEEALLRELQGLAQEMNAAGFPESLRWSEKLAQLIGDSAEDAASEDSSAIEPKDVLTGRFEIDGEDVSDLVHQVAQAFVWPEDGAWSDQRSALVLDRLADFSMICRLRGSKSDQEKIEAAVKDFKVIYESPIGVDEGLLSVVWANVAMVIERFHPEESPVAAVAVSKEPEPEAASETPSAQQTKRARSIRVNENHLDRFLDDVSALFITCERLKDVQSRMVVSETIGELVEELRQINVTFSTQATNCRRVSYRCVKCLCEVCCPSFRQWPANWPMTWASRSTCISKGKRSKSTSR